MSDIQQVIEKALGLVASWRAERLPDRPEDSDATGFSGTVFDGVAGWRFELVRWTMLDVTHSLEHPKKELRVDGMAMGTSPSALGVAMRVSTPELRAAALKALEKEKQL